MNVLLINTQDTAGGAARAAYRLHQGLQQQGITSRLLVQQQFSADPQVIAPKTRLAQGMATARLTLDALPLKQYTQRQPTTFSPQWLPNRVAHQVAQLQPDLINLHWINEGFVPIEAIARFNKPIVWTLHDMWPFTGGCHYSGNCLGYQGQCGNCPQLGSRQSGDLSHWIWRRKAKAWQSVDITMVALCRWMADCLRQSSLFCHAPIEIIPNGLDTEQFRPIEQAVARRLLKLPEDRHLLLFGSLKATSDKRKGFHLLQPALQALTQTEWGDRVELVVFGADRPEHPPDFGFKTHYLGSLHDDLSLALAYSAADLFILPSVEENLANTILESLACGTPCVAFEIGGMPDLIEHQQNGYLAKPYSIDALAQGIIWILENQERYQKLSDRARQKVMQEFTLEIQSQRYQQLFEQKLSQLPKSSFLGCPTGPYTGELAEHTGELAEPSSARNLPIL